MIQNVLLLDHLLTFANVRNVDEYVEQYRALGFDVTDETRPYQPGLRNRFIQLGCEYLELVWVENEDQFRRGGTEEFARMFPELPVLRQAARPFSIGFVCENVEALHQQWTTRGLALPKVWSFAPPGMPPILSFQEIPSELLPGIDAFAIAYHGAPPTRTRIVRRAPNTVYAVEGISLVAGNPAERAAQWQQLLDSDGAVSQQDGVHFATFPPHTARWVTPETFEGRYQLHWTPAPHPYGELAAIHLLAEDLAVCAERLGQRAHRLPAMLVMSPAAEDGVVFIIREYPGERWREERSRATGEMLRWT